MSLPIVNLRWLTVVLGWTVYTGKINVISYNFWLKLRFIVVYMFSSLSLNIGNWLIVLRCIINYYKKSQLLIDKELIGLRKPYFLYFKAIQANDGCFCNFWLSPYIFSKYIILLTQSCNYTTLVTRVRYHSKQLIKSGQVCVASRKGYVVWMNIHFIGSK